MRGLLRVLVSLLVLSLVAIPSVAQDAGAFDGIVQSYVQNQTFMGSVLVARGGQVLFSNGYGSANLEWEIPNAPSTKFRLGSITKQFTAASILLLVERGKLKLDDPIKAYVVDAPAAWDRITIFNLLTHSAGLPNFTSLPDYKSLELSETPPAKVIARIRDLPLDFFPGEKMAYSNSGYIVLGAIIERVSGLTYEQFVRDIIFAPLGMKDSGYDSNSAVIAHRASGYAPSPAGPINAGYIHMSVPHAAGALYSTTEDLLRWEQALFGGKILSGASLEKMTTPFKNDYAFGLVVQTVDGRKVVQHGGGIEGFNTFLAYYPDDKLTIAVLANINGPAPGAIASKLATIAHGGTITSPEARKEISVPAPTLQKYLGTYELAPGMRMWIRLEDGHLTTQLAGQPILRLRPESETKFFLRAVDAQIDFVVTGGDVTGLVLHQNGRDVNARRTSNAIVGAPNHTEIAVPAATLAKYTGTYQLRPNVELSITLDNAQLSAQMSGQPRIGIFPETETRFFYRVVDASLEFQLNASGATTGVRLRQGPVDELMPRKPQ